MPTPILPTSTKFSWWRANEIYPTGQFVPNEEDLVIMPNDTIQRVREVDPVTHVSVLEPYMISNPVGPTDSFVVSQSSDDFQLYLNTQTVPYAAAIDARLSINGASNSYAKVFRGNDVGPSGQVISAMINGLGQIVSENVPLENVVLPGVNNISLKTLVPFFLTEALNDNDNVYVVVYTGSGIKTSIFKLEVRQTNFVRTLDASKLIVTSIEMESSYLNPLDNRLIEIPANMVLQSANLRGRVTYSNGSSAVYPIDGVRFNVFGLDSYVASYPGFTADLVLSYKMGPNEFGLGLSGDPSNRTIMEPYRIRTVEQSAVYAVKLFAIPVWNSVNNRWALTYYLYSLDREQIYDVTSFVETVVGSTAFNGSTYNVPQELRVAINLEAIGPSFVQYRHVQVFTITLSEAATNNMTGNYWSIRYSNISVYGQNAFATIDPSNNLRIDCGFGSTGSWIDNMFYTLEPLRSLSNELLTPAPTHVRIMNGTALVREIPISAVLNPIVGVSGVGQGTNLRLELYRLSGSDMLELAAAGLNVKAI